MLSFEQGVAFGQALCRLQDHETRITRVEQEVETVKSLAIRGGLLLVLWIGGLALNLPAERVGAFTASFLSALSK